MTRVRPRHCEKLHFGKPHSKQVGLLLYNKCMENEPDTTNVHYIDEYPELQKRLWLRRLAQERLGSNVVAMTTIVPFKRPDTPDGAA